MPGRAAGPLRRRDGGPWPAPSSNPSDAHLVTALTSCGTATMTPRDLVVTRNYARRYACSKKKLLRVVVYGGTRSASGGLKWYKRVPIQPEQKQPQPPDLRTAPAHPNADVPRPLRAYDRQQEPHEPPGRIQDGAPAAQRSPADPHE